MKKFIALCATALALAAPGMAQAANYGTDGKYKFQGSIEMIKNLPAWTTCTLTVEIDVSGGGTIARVLSTPAPNPSLSGPSPCSGITFSNQPYTANALGSPVSVLTLATVKVNIPPILIFPADACQGTLTTLWGGNTVTPRTITLQDGVSNLPDTNPDNIGATENPCRIKGTLTQISGPTQLTITP